jgi:hypothetical protein
MDLVTAIAELEAGQSDEVMLAQLQERTVDTVGSLSGGKLAGLLAKFGLLAFIQDQINATGDYSVIRNICIAISQRLLPEGEVQLNDIDNLMLLDMFLADATVYTIISATGQTNEAIKNVVLAAATVTEPEFPGIRMVDLVKIRGAK